MQILFDLVSFIGKKATLLIVSMMPLIELRGGVIIGATMNMDWLTVFIISIIGNIIPIPFVILFGRRILRWLKTTRLFSKIAHKYEEGLIRKSKGITKYSIIGLCIFVAIPLPGTGAWSGAVIATLLDMRMKYAVLSIAVGVIIAGVIMTVGSYSILNVINLF